MHKSILRRSPTSRLWKRSHDSSHGWFFRGQILRKLWYFSHHLHHGKRVRVISFSLQVNWEGFQEIHPDTLRYIPSNLEKHKGQIFILCFRTLKARVKAGADERKREVSMGVNKASTKNKMEHVFALAESQVGGAGLQVMFMEAPPRGFPSREQAEGSLQTEGRGDCLQVVMSVSGWRRGLSPYWERKHQIFLIENVSQVFIKHHAWK